MNRYQVRTHQFSTFGEHKWDYDLEPSEPLEDFAARLALKGFLERDGEKWIMPGAITWIAPQ